MTTLITVLRRRIGAGSQADLRFLFALRRRNCLLRSFLHSIAGHRSACNTVNIRALCCQNGCAKRLQRRTANGRSFAFAGCLDRNDSIFADLDFNRNRTAKPLRLAGIYARLIRLRETDTAKGQQSRRQQHSCQLF